MIHNDKELEATQERIIWMQKILAGMRVKAKASEFEMASQGYRMELEKMHREVMEYLTTPPTKISA